VDVGLFINGRIAGFVEVLHTHETAAEKRAALEATAGWPCPVVEIKAINLVAEHYPKRFECISPRRCTPCIAIAIEQRRVETLERYAAFFRGVLWQFRVRRLVESILVEDLIDAIVAATERVARRWLLKIRVRHLAATLARDAFTGCGTCGERMATGTWFNLCTTRRATTFVASLTDAYCGEVCIPYCFGCDEPTTSGKWCACKRKRMAKCAVCNAWAEKTAMNAALPKMHNNFALWMHPGCGKQCTECDRSFCSDKKYEHVLKCFRCNYEKKHGYVWSPNGDGFPDGFCSQCDKYIRTTRYEELCWGCSH
jgi:hypothetical protein